MRSRVHAVVLSPEVGDFADEVRRVFVDLGRRFGPDALTGECSPPLDVYETDETIEITMDLPAVEPPAVRVIVKGDGVLIAGEKAARRARGESSFHLVERDFGRFARTIRLGQPFDINGARASLVDGELRVTFPKLRDRRGRTVEIPIAAGEEGSRR